MAIETMQLSDALLQNPSVVEEIVGIPHGFDTDGIATDGIFIMFHRKLDNYPLMMKPDNWASYQNSGEIADGVVVVEGGNILVVAPTEESLYWSSAEVSAGGKTTTDRLTALDDWTGKQIQQYRLYILNVAEKTMHRGSAQNTAVQMLMVRDLRLGNGGYHHWVN